MHVVIPDFYEQALYFARKVEKTQYQVATVESCTSGAIAQRLTQIPNASKWYKGGLVVYQTQLKQQLLNIPESFFETHSVVSEACIELLLEKGAQVLNADIVLATTGDFGPDTAGRKLGNVYFGIRILDTNFIFNYQFSGTRLEISNKTLQRVFIDIKRVLNKTI